MSGRFSAGLRRWLRAPRAGSIIGRMLLAVAVLALAASLTGASVVARSAADDSESAMVWAAYVDPRFDFSVEYPADWNVTPRVDLPDSVGGSVIFEDPDSAVADPGGSARPRIEIGLYLRERDPYLSLAEWSQEYDAKCNSFESRVISTRKLDLAGRDAFRKQGISLQTAYTRVNLAHGRTVWFVWTNALDGEQLAIHDRVVGSLRFGSNAPRTLEEAYGRSLHALGEYPTKPPDSQTTSVSPLALSGYTAPVTAYADILCGDSNAPVCSGSHTGEKRYAIDIRVAIGTVVQNSARANVCWTGWTDGMGWQVQMTDTYLGYVAFYGHLSSINPDLAIYKEQHWVVPQYFRLGLSGNSGRITTGAHLHFHVQAGGPSPVRLDGMSNLTLYSSYPDCSCATCGCILELQGDQCTCGRVN